MSKETETAEIQLGEYTLRREGDAIFVQHESGEGMEVSKEKFAAFFNELWKDF